MISSNPQPSFSKCCQRPTLTLDHVSCSFFSLFLHIEVSESTPSDKVSQLAEKLIVFYSNYNYQFIENIESFRKNYQKRIEEENKLEKPIHLLNYGTFDLSTMHPPKFVKTEQGLDLVFFVHNSMIPYQVSICSKSSKPQPKFDCLGYL